MSIGNGRFGLNALPASSGGSSAVTLWTPQDWSTADANFAAGTFPEGWIPSGLLASDSATEPATVDASGITMFSQSSIAGLVGGDDYPNATVQAPAQVANFDAYVNLTSIFKGSSSTLELLFGLWQGGADATEGSMAGLRLEWSGAWYVTKVRKHFNTASENNTPGQTALGYDPTSGFQMRVKLTGTLFQVYHRALSTDSWTELGSALPCFRSASNSAGSVFGARNVQLLLGSSASAFCVWDEFTNVAA